MKRGDSSGSRTCTSGESLLIRSLTPFSQRGRGLADLDNRKPETMRSKHEATALCIKGIVDDPLFISAHERWSEGSGASRSRQGYHHNNLTATRGPLQSINIALSHQTALTNKIASRQRARSNPDTITTVHKLYYQQ
jgi:hypothetical protein